jgi:hypothetical protein
MMGAPPPFPWRLAVICGLLWGVVVMLADTLTQPVGDLRPMEWAIFSIGVAFQLSGAGLVWTFGARWAEASARPLPILAATLPVAWAISVVGGFLPFRVVPAMSTGMGQVMSGVPTQDIALHLLWNNLFYGGLYVGGYFSMRRAMRLRRRLAELRLAHGEADMRLRETRLDAFHGQIQPATLLDALAALRMRYGRDARAGDRLFDRLVTFLRAAMPGLRGDRSTLSGELALVASYAQLREDLDAAAAPWRLKLSDLPIDPPFPAFRLLPALDRLGRALRPDGALEISTSVSTDDPVVIVRATGLRPTADLVSLLRRDLGLVFGVKSTLAVDADDSLRLELRLPGGGKFHRTMDRDNSCQREPHTVF